MDTKTRREFIDIAASPERVWNALTDTAESARWYFGTGIESSFEAGARYHYTFPDGRVAIEGTIITADAPHTIDMTFHAIWGENVAKDEPTRVIWSVERVGEGSRVSVTHENLVPGSATEQEVASGWPELLNRLKHYLESSRETTIEAIVQGKAMLSDPDTELFQNAGSLRKAIDV
ncbi:MAG: SRPBCC domain-containing protein [Ancrocorticia sp.]